MRRHRHHPHVGRVPADTPAGNYRNWVSVFTTDAPGSGDTPVAETNALGVTVTRFRGDRGHLTPCSPQAATRRPTRQIFNGGPSDAVSVVTIPSRQALNWLRFAARRPAHDLQPGNATRVRSPPSPRGHRAPSTP
ncbi:MAG: hypothetical protein R2856_06855 [Caldilineaceae bacterium]